MAEKFFSLPCPQVNEDTTTSWDSTYQQKWQDIVREKSTLCPHAVACDGHVYGCNAAQWLTWKRSFAPHQIHQVVSNTSGTIIAVSTDVGNVSILRGSDGTVLASRKVGNSPANMAFLNQTNQFDTLLIQNDISSFIRVSNIDSQALSEDATTTEATRNMVLQPITIDYEPEAWAATYSNSATLTLLTIDSSGLVKIWSLNEKHSFEMISENQLVDEEDVVIDISLGMNVLSISQRLLCTCNMISDESSTLLWLDPFTGEKVFNYQLPLTDNRRPRILSVCSLISTHAEEAAALAIVAKYSGDEPQCKIHVVHYLAEETLGLTVCSHPHTIYSIDLPNDVVQASLARLDTSFSFRVKISEKDGSSSFHCFSPDSETISKVAYYNILLEQGNFDQADEFLARDGLLHELSSDPMIRFDASEPALRRLKYLVSNVTTEEDQFNEPFMRLATAAASSGKIQDLVEKIEYLLSLFREPSARVVLSFLEASIAALNKVSTNLWDAGLTIATKKREQLEHHRSTLMFLLDEVGNAVVPPQTMKTTAHLFQFLIQNQHFDVAQKLYREYGKERISGDHLLSVVLHIPAGADPSGYKSLLVDDILSTVVINHSMVPKLRDWCCQIANELERNPAMGLDAAMELLSIITQGLKDASVRIHQPFSTFSPFTSNVRIGKARRSPKVSTSGDLSISVGPDQAVLSKSTREQVVDGIPIPSILEPGAMASGASLKATRRVALSGDVDESLSTSDSEDRLAEKMEHARCLLAARSLGLPIHCIGLANFAEKGGAFFCAENLVDRCSQAGTHSHLESFCEEFRLCYDEVLVAHVESRCRNKNVDEDYLKNAGVVLVECKSPENKCRAALSILNAARVCSCHADWLKQLACDALRWSASNSKLRSELEESSRLHSIDGVVMKYCGPAARDLFRVDNPRHAFRLMEYVCKNASNDSVVDDLFALSDAFVNISLNEACSRLMRNAIHDLTVSPITIFSKIHSRNEAVGRKAFSATIVFVDSSLRELSSVRGNQVEPTAEAMESLEVTLRRTIELSSYLITSVFNEKLEDRCKDLDRLVGIDSYQLLKQKLDFIMNLVNRYRIILSLDDLYHPSLCSIILSHLLADVDEIPEKMKRVESVAAWLGRLSGHTSELFMSIATESICRGMLEEENLDGLVEFCCSMKSSLERDPGLFTRSMMNVSEMMLMCIREENEPRKVITTFVSTSALTRNVGLFSCPRNSINSTWGYHENLDIACRTLLQGDNGLGESISSEMTKIRPGAEEDAVSAIRPASKLHSTWYLGDGLLLPSGECLSFLTDFSCNRDISKASRVRAIQDLVYLTRDRGAHAHALSLVLYHFTLPSASAKSNYIDEISFCLQDTCRNLLERSLGGTSSGIMSQAVDSQMAIAFLPYLSSSLAMKLLRSPMSTALKTSAFERFMNLANTAYVATTVVDPNSTSFMSRSTWIQDEDGSRVFCRLSQASVWWKYFQTNHIPVDPIRFVEKNLSERDICDALAITSCQEVSEHLEDGLEPLEYLVDYSIERSSTYFESLRLCHIFASDFGVEADLLKYYLLERVLLSAAKRGWDEKKAFSSAILRSIHPLLKRATFLRKIVIKLERATQKSRDYECHNAALALYREALLHVLDHQPSFQGNEVTLFERELELVDRRRDTLEILSSYFGTGSSESRPPFTSFFPSLPERLDMSDNPCLGRLTILGHLEDSKEDDFDPLRMLEPTLQDPDHRASVSAFAPLCFSLGLPNGYIHARALLLQFQQSASYVEVPSYHHDVLPVLEKLRDQRDRCILASWCAKRYGKREKEKLDCLKYALDAAVQSSIEIESSQSARQNQNELDRALERIQHLERWHAALADRISIKTVFESDKACTVDMHSLKQKLVADIMSLWTDETGPSPEEALTAILERSSMLIANACIEKSIALSVPHVRQLSSLISKACSVLSETYSHIHIESFVQKMVRTLLFYGNTSATGGTHFIPERSDNSGDRKESVLLVTSSREKEERLHQLASVRISFLLSLIDPKSPDSNNSTPDENCKPPENATKNSLSKRRPRLLKKLDTLRETKKRSAAYEHSKELLKVVFVKSSLSSKMLLLDDLDSPRNDEAETVNPVTFAMRYRALRAAALLCPQITLEQVLRDEGMLDQNLRSDESLLKVCTFGSFVAKEIEEMGLQVPHSDLVQLSTMDYRSYARTLWKHCQESGSSYDGRFLLLLAEMMSKGKLESPDAAFLDTILGEMTSNGYARSFLIAAESLEGNGFELKEKHIKSLASAFEIARQDPATSNDEVSRVLKLIERSNHAGILDTLSTN